MMDTTNRKDMTKNKELFYGDVNSSVVFDQPPQDLESMNICRLS